MGQDLHASLPTKVFHSSKVPGPRDRMQCCSGNMDS